MDLSVFTQMAEQAGIYTTKDAWQAKWNHLNRDQGMVVTNKSKWSPFWQLITAIATAPAVSFGALVTSRLMPDMFLQTACDRGLDLLAAGYDVTRSPATKMQGFVTFEREGEGAGDTLVAGTVVCTPQINGQVCRVLTTEKAVFAPESQTAEVPVEAELPGAAANLAPGYYCLLQEPQRGITVRAGSDRITVPGFDAESDAALRLRCRNRFMAAGRWHHDAVYRDLISRFARIPVDYIWFEHGAPRGPCSANAYIMTDSGSPPRSFTDSINRYLEASGEHGHGDDLRCFPVPLTPVLLKPHIAVNSTWRQERKAELVTGVQEMIRCAFRQNRLYGSHVTQTTPFSRFSFSRLAGELHAYFPALFSVEFHHDDIETKMALTHFTSLEIITE